MFGVLAISQIILGTSTISFLSSAFVISEVFCGNSYQYSHSFTYFRTYVEHPIPIGAKQCIIRNRDIIGNVFTKIVNIE